MRLIAVIMWAILAGCTGHPAPATYPKINLAGYPLEFRQGYAEGCASAQPYAGPKRDEMRFKSDPNYAQGWQDGYDICRRQK